MKPTFLFAALTSLALAVGAPLAAQAPSPDRLEAASALIDAMDMEAIMKETLEQTLEAQTRMMPKVPGDQARVDSMLAATRAITRKYVTRALEWSELQDDVALLYAQTFTTGQLRQLEEFYRSPLGRTLLEATPELTAGVQLITGRRMQAIMPEMMQEMMAVMRDYGGS